MTIYQFNALSENKKAKATWDGVLIADRNDKEHNILLYQIDSFYVEVYYHIELNKLTRLRPFTTTELLLPYLDQINLNEIY